MSIAVRLVLGILLGNLAAREVITLLENQYQNQYHTDIFSFSFD